MTSNENIQSSPNRKRTWAIFGATGFVGTGVVRTLQRDGVYSVEPVRTPRISCNPTDDASDVLEIFYAKSQIIEVFRKLVSALDGIDVVINAAGMAAPDSPDSPELYGANSLLPVVIAEAAKEAGVEKFIHISSAAVQGRKDTLDESSLVNPFSPYSQSKVCGEKTLNLWSANQTQNDPLPSGVDMEVIVIRATSVQGEGRSTSNTLNRIAASPLASVAAPGTQPSVVSSLEGLSQFIVNVGLYSDRVPPMIIQPWEGASVRDVLELSGGGRIPRTIPTSVAKLGITTLNALGKVVPRFRGLSRRLEVMWFGQKQIPGWAAGVGLAPVPQKGPADTLRRALNGDN